MKIAINDSSILTAVMLGKCSPAIRRDVIAEVVQTLPLTSAEFQHAFGEHLRANVRLPGFRDAQLALKNTAGTQRLIANLSEASPHILVPVLRGWLELHADLAEAVQTFTEATPTIQIDEGMIESLMSDGLEAKWLKDHVREFQVQHTNFSENDAAIMLCLSLTVDSDSTPDAPPPDETGQGLSPIMDSAPPQATHSGRWQSWLNELAALPPDDSEWDAVEAFVDALRALAEAKRTELAVCRAALSDTLRRLREEESTAIEWFQWDDLAHWTAEDVDLRQVTQVAGQMCVLREALLEHQALLQQRVNNRDTYTRQQARLAELEQQIEGLHTELGAHLAPSGVEAPLPALPLRDPAPVDEEPPPTAETAEPATSSGAPPAPTLPPTARLHPTNRTRCRLVRCPRFRRQKASHG